MLVDRTYVEGRRITIYQDKQEVALEAPRRLWQCVVRLCDGTRNLEELGGQLPGTIDPDSFRDFVHFLLDHGVLVDGKLATVRALAYANQMSPYGQPEPAQIIHAIPRRFSAIASQDDDAETVVQAPWMSVYQRRHSSYAFDNSKSLTENELTSLLWASFGVVADEHERLGAQVPRRTLASAGALYGMQLYLGLKRSIGKHAPGIYRVDFPGPHRVRLKRVNGQHALLLRSFVQPWNAQFAQGVLFLTGDCELVAAKYRNRAVQYLFMEAGAALHNCALAATELEVGFSTLGCHDESVVQTLCETTHIVLASAAFGPKPSDLQIKQAKAARAFELSWQEASVDAFAPLNVAKVSLSDIDSPMIEAWGMDQSVELAYRKACSEAMERLGWHTPRDCVLASAQDLAAYQHPDFLIRYSPSQYQRKSFPFRKFDVAEERWWAPGFSLNSGKTTWLPADLVFARADLVRSGHATEHLLTFSTTSGCAAAATSEAAIEHGLHELVEHDAFMRHWLDQTGGSCVATHSLPSELRIRLERLNHLCGLAGVQRLTSPWAHVFLVWAQSDDAGFTTIGTAAHQDPLRALTHAFDELESRVHVWVNGHSAVSRGSKEVRSPRDHFEIYGQRKHFRKADTLLRACGPTVLFDSASDSVPQGCSTLTSLMLSQGMSPLIVDITPDRASIDLGRTPLVAIKAFVPGLIPMSFGYGLEPLGMCQQRTRHVPPFPHPFP